MNKNHSTLLEKKKKKRSSPKKNHSCNITPVTGVIFFRIYQNHSCNNTPITCGISSSVQFFLEYTKIIHKNHSCNNTTLLCHNFADIKLKHIIFFAVSMHTCVNPPKAKTKTSTTQQNFLSCVNAH